MKVLYFVDRMLTTCCYKVPSENFNAGVAEGSDNLPDPQGPDSEY